MNKNKQIKLIFTLVGVRYMPGGVASGFTHVETNANGEKRLFQVKGKKNIRVKLVCKQLIFSLVFRQFSTAL